MIGEAAREHRRLEPHPSSVAESRRLIRDVLGEAHGDWMEQALLCVSELVTNAVVHAGTTVEVTVLLFADGLRVEVVDRSPHLPVRRSYASLAGTGRGLMMVDQMSERWGVLTNDDGKTVWFELGLAADPGIDSEASTSMTATRASVSVSLVNMPLLLHSAWRMHAESLLRELLLVRLDEGGLEQLEAHAAASEAISVLQEQVPIADVGENREGIMAAATEPFVSMENLEIQVPLASVPNFEILDLLLEAAATLADSGQLMTPGTQPEIRAFRRWLCGQVTRQAQGGAATAWDPDAVDSGAAVLEALPWDANSVSLAETAVIGADDGNRIVAASREALALLGYRAEGDLVGRRLVDIVPFRFRQAHVAGFTLHMFAGRSALIGVPVEVPVLCADGAERVMELTVSTHSLPRGRHVFTADLRLPRAG